MGHGADADKTRFRLCRVPPIKKPLIFALFQVQTRCRRASRRAKMREVPPKRAPLSIM